MSTKAKFNPFGRTKWYTLEYATLYEDELTDCTQTFPAENDEYGIIVGASFLEAIIDDESLTEDELVYAKLIDNNGNELYTYIEQ